MSTSTLTFLATPLDVSCLTLTRAISKVQEVYVLFHFDYYSWVMYKDHEELVIWFNLKELHNLIKVSKRSILEVQFNDCRAALKQAWLSY